MDAKYTATATATGGRDGHAKSNDDNLDVNLAAPKELGGEGGNATNPEQLFAAGYAACFTSALELAASKKNVDFPDNASVKAEVGIGEHGESFALQADLHIDLPGLSKDDAQAIAEKAHELCPYSKATRGNIDVNLHVKAA